MMQQNKYSNRRIMVVEDDAELREALCDTLELADYGVCAAASGAEALEILQQTAVDMVITDVNMPGMDGHELLVAIRNQFVHLPVMLITAFGSISKSVEAMRHGAVDYLVKPFEPEVLLDCVARYTGAFEPEQEEPVAEESSSRELLQLARRVAVTESTVLVFGESGTGKEVLARFIHRHSMRAGGPFVAINCAAIPDNMLESVLFGHEKGAFTGAYHSLPGKFEQANGGTLLLDEISELELGLQAKILRVLQEHEVERVGGRKLIPLDVRLIATTNRVLQDEVAAGRFREDLYYRLSVFPLQWLPLRERVRDILPLAERLLQHHATKMCRQVPVMEESARGAILRHPWPGNVRELDNVIQRALIMAPGESIAAVHLRLDTPLSGAVTARTSPGQSQITIPAAIPASIPVDIEYPDGAGTVLGDDLKRREYEIIMDTLKSARGSRKRAAEHLGISSRTLRYKLARMREMGLDPDVLLSV